MQMGLCNPLIRTFVRTTGEGVNGARFPIRKKATAASLRTTEVYHPSRGSCISKLLNPQRADPASQDALGLITLYPRPDELSSFPRPLQPVLFQWQEILSCHCYYTIDLQGSQHKYVISKYNGLPVHA